MRWGAETFEYARPIQWVLCLFGDAPVKFPVADVKSGNSTYGHRFLSQGPGCNHRSCGNMLETLKTNYIIINEEERMETVREGITTDRGRDRGSGHP